jgi:hypothetical protein
MMRLSNKITSEADFFIVKVFGRHRRTERTLKILHDLHANSRPTVCVYEDYFLQEKLGALDMTCLSFRDAIDQNMESTAWSEAIAVKSKILALMSTTPFKAKNYRCPEGLLGVDADQFASLATLLLLRDKLVNEGFKRVILLPSERSFSHIPDDPLGIYSIVADGGVWERSRPLLKRAFTFFLPFLAILRRQTIFQEWVAYSTRHTSRDCLDGMSIRVLVVATDVPVFPSYYSRPAASIGEACVKDGHQTLIVTNVVASPVEFLRHGFKRMQCRKLVLPEIWAIWKEALRLRQHVSDYMRRASERTSTNLWGLACALVRENLAIRASAMTAAVVLFDDIFTRFLPTVLVVIPDSSYFGIAAVAVARRKKVPSLTALAGQIFDHPLYGFLNADYVAVNSDSAKEVYLRRGISSDRVFVTGIAHYDETFRLAESLKSQKQAETKVIVFATENLPLAETFAMISPVASAALTIPRVKVIIRPHPREDPSNYIGFISGFASDRITLDSTTPLLELLSKGDVCVTGFSNVAVEAMILGCPVICMNLSGKADKLPYAQEGAALGVHHPDEAGPALARALFDEETKTSLTKKRTMFLKKEFCTITGDASLRIARVIGKLATKSMNKEQIKPFPCTGCPDPHVSRVVSPGT